MTPTHSMTTCHATQTPEHKSKLQSLAVGCLHGSVRTETDNSTHLISRNQKRRQKMSATAVCHQLSPETASSAHSLEQIASNPYHSPPHCSTSHKSDNHCKLVRNNQSLCVCCMHTTESQSLCVDMVLHDETHTPQNEWSCWFVDPLLVVLSLSTHPQHPESKGT